MQRIALVACVSLASLAALGCSAGDTSSTGTSSVVQPIYKGTADTTTDAVMALSINLGGGQGGSCSGTVVAVKGNSGYYLTAAHCVVAKDAKGNLTKTVLKPSQLFVIAGPDYMDPKATAYPVSEVKIHPSFNTSSLLYDFAMIRFTFNGAAPAVIPAMTPAEDTLKAGSQLDVIGYGQTDKDPQNSKRNRALMNVSYITGNGALVVLGEENNTSITCQGDSGGPGMFGSGNAKRVATVTSFGFTEACTIDTAGVGRVSKVHDSFIKPFIDGSTGTLSCDECTNSATISGGKCASQAEKCAAGTPCDTFLKCAEACGDNNSACVAKCQQDHKEGALTYFAIFDCVCDVGCPAECGTEDFCQGNACGFTVSPEGFPTCNTCVEAKCCDVDKACFDDVDCNNCATSSNPGAACNSNAKYNAFLDCIGGSCGEECGAGGSAKCGFTSQTPACQTCFEGACCAEFTACSNDALCTDCTTGKKTGAECQNHKPYADAIGCLSGKCGAECGGGSAKCGFTADASCQTCFEGACCAEFTACSNDTLCTECMTGKKTGAECQGNKSFTDAIGCLNGKCGAECSGGSGGTGGAGGSGAGGSIGSAGSSAGGSGGSSQAGSGGSGQAGSGDAGSGQAGSGTAGSGDAGSGPAAGGTESGTAGSSAGGSGGAGTSNPVPGANATDDGGGCGCQVPGTGSSPPGAALAALSALGMLFRRRRR
jgi:MYXO-CTERM domain-containing protein